MMIGSDELEQFVCSSTEALEIKFVQCQEDFTNEELAFRPVYTHQLFGDQERIFGYKDLKIQLYYTPDHLDTYLSYTCSDRVDPTKHYGTKPDDVLGSIIKFIPPGFIPNKDNFLSLLQVRKPFTPFGELVHKFLSRDLEQYEIYKVHAFIPGFKDYHEKLQTFLLWFIDAASFIDIDDEKWSFYLIFKRSLDCGVVQYSIAGYLSLYNFYAYPDKIRPRISQFLILPPFQRKGLGTQLLQALYTDLLASKDIMEVLVEDPSPEFVALRDYVDCQNARKLQCFQPHQILSPYSQEIERQCRNKLKIGKIQCRRVYEILKLGAIDRSNSQQYYDYRVFVKNRLNGPYQKQKRDVDRLQRMGIMDHAELAVAAAPLSSSEDRMRELQQIYEEVEMEYQSVLEKLAASD